MKRNILIVNFTRMGDLLQSTSLIEGLKRKHPGAKITIAVLDDFRGICSGFKDVDRIFPVEVNRFTARLGDAKVSLEELHTHLSRVMKRLGGGFDLVINLSHTTLSAVFCLLTEGGDMRGMVMTPDGAIVVRHPWMDYFFNVSRDRSFNTFNLVDMYNLTGEIDLVSRKLSYEVPAADKLFPEQLFEGRKGRFIGFQLGASSEDRQWTPESFGRLAEIITRQPGWNIVVFGRGKERELLDRMRAVYSGPLIDAIDKTSMSQLAAAVERCDMLITNDTGAMHAASAVGTPVIAVFMGEARALDTGPFAEKALVLEANLSCAPCGYHTKCLDHKCHQCVKPENVHWAMENFEELTNGEVRQMPDEARWADLKISRPVFEEDGFWSLAPLIRRPLRLEDLMMGLYRRMWKSVLCPGEQHCAPDFHRFHSEPSEPDMAERLDKLQTLARRLEELGGEGLKVTAKMREASSPPNVSALKRLMRDMILVDNSIYQIELTAPELSMIAADIRLRKNNTEREELDYIISLAEELYRDLCFKSRLMAGEIEQYMNETFALEKGIAV